MVGRGRGPTVRRLTQRTPAHPGPAYARGMGFLILLVIVGALVAAYVFRVQLLSKILGQDEARVRRQLERRKR